MTSSYGGGGICPQKLPKRSANRQFQTKTPKSLHRNIYATLDPTNQEFKDRTETTETTKYTSRMVGHYPKINSTWLTAAILKIDITSYFSRGCPIWTKCGSLMQIIYRLWGDVAEIETESRIPMWRTLAFPSASAGIGKLDMRS